MEMATYLSPEAELLQTNQHLTSRIDEV